MGTIFMADLSPRWPSRSVELEQELINASYTETINSLQVCKSITAQLSLAITTGGYITGNSEDKFENHGTITVTGQPTITTPRTTPRQLPLGQLPSGATNPLVNTYQNKYPLGPLPLYDK